MNSKPAYLSKTLWVNLLVGGLALFLPGAKEWVAAHPEVATGALAGVNILLRLVTKGKLELW
jgi:hypothetical protein